MSWPELPQNNAPKNPESPFGKKLGKNPNLNEKENNIFDAIENGDCPDNLKKWLQECKDNTSYNLWSLAMELNTQYDFAKAEQESNEKSKIVFISMLTNLSKIYNSSVSLNDIDSYYDYSCDCIVEPLSKFLPYSLLSEIKEALEPIRGAWADELRSFSKDLYGILYPKLLDTNFLEWLNDKTLVSTILDWISNSLPKPKLEDLFAKYDWEE